MSAINAIEGFSLMDFVDLVKVSLYFIGSWSQFEYEMLWKILSELIILAATVF